ncbi:MAG: hypothetical protein SGILL_003805 [Bacillariaceae sp.]
MVTTRRRTRSLSTDSLPNNDETDAVAVTTTRRRTRSLSTDASTGRRKKKDASSDAAKKVSKVKTAAVEKKSPRRRTRSRGASEDVDMVAEKKGQKETPQEAVETLTEKLVEEVSGKDDVDGDDGDGSKRDNDRDVQDINDMSKNKNDEASDEEEDDGGGDDDDIEQQQQKKLDRVHLSPKTQAGSKSRKKRGNALTHLIPGYTAPMKLNTSSLDKFRPSGGIRDLQKRAERTDASTKDFVLEATSEHTKAMRKSSGGFLPKSYSASYSNFKRGTKRAPDTSAGKGWFGMAPSEMTDELKTDLAVIRNRAYLDPKKFYKSSDKHHKIVQIGTVIEGPSEYWSSRLTKKQRRSNITEEIMADPASADYAKKKFKQMSREKNRQAEMRKHKPKRAKKFY